MEEDDKTIHLRREDLRELEERFVKWQQSYLEYQRTYEEFRLLQAHFDLLLRTWRRPARQFRVKHRKKNE